MGSDYTGMWGAAFLEVSRLCFGITLTALCINFRQFSKVDKWLLVICNAMTRSTEPSFSSWLNENGKFVSWLHAPIVFVMLFASEGAEEGWMHYLLALPCLFVLWDCGAVFDNIKLRMLLNLHHAGAVIAYVHQPREQSNRARLNTLFFALAWAIHALPAIEHVVLPLIGLPKVKGNKYVSMEIVRYLYGALMVYCYHLYLNADDQLGLGYNYQTAAVGSLLIGRGLAHDNWKFIDWARRVEVPGIVLVTFAHMLGNYKLGTCALVTLVVGITSIKVAKFQPIPEHYALTSEMYKLMASQYGRKPVCEPLLPFPIEMTKSWWHSNPTWSTNWPLHEAALFGDTQAVIQCLEEGVDPELEMVDWHGTTPAAFGAFFGQLDVVIMLLQNGVNPYKSCNHPQFVGFVSTSVMQLLRGHSHAKRFADKFHLLAMKASPSKRGDTLMSRLLAVVKQF